MVDKDTKKNYARLIAEHLGLDPEEPLYHSKGGTETKKFYIDIAYHFGVVIPSTANKAEAARLAIISVGGGPENAISSTGGTETKATLKEIYNNL